MDKKFIYLINYSFMVFLLISCKSDYEEYKVEDFEFYIDSVYNITETSVTIQATLYTPQVEKNIIGLKVLYGKVEEKYMNNTGTYQSFDKKEGTVTMQIDNLEPNTEYYLSPSIDIAHGTNPNVAYITGMGSPFADVTFTTRGNLPDSGTVTDIDGNVYNYITIGNQTWMVENLRTTRLRDGTPIPHVKDSTKWTLSWDNQGLQTSLSYCDYKNDTVYGKKYGHIYDIQASRSVIAPKGWHVPTRSDWFILINYLISNGYNFDKSTEENRIGKSLASGTTDWLMGTYYDEGSIIKNLTLNNSTGFTALPGGYRSRDGVFKDVGVTCSLWSSTHYYQYNFYVYLESGRIDLFLDDSYKLSGMYIRCIRDN